MSELVVSVHGSEPAPQGSKSASVGDDGRARMWESSKRVKPWRQAVVYAAEMAIMAVGRDWRILDEPLHLVVVFFVRSPKTMPRGRVAPTVYPDLDKCIRSTADALTEAGVYRDDSRIVAITAQKRYATAQRGVGAWISIRSWEPPS